MCAGRAGRRYPRRVDRICPFLALADDGRTVADGFDPAHRCQALIPPVALERSRQAQLCLTEAHVRCERFSGARAALLAASSGLPRVAPDVAFARTRVVVEPEPRRSLGTGAARRPPRILLLGGLAAGAVALVLVLGGLLAGGTEPSPSATPSPSASATVAPASSTPAASASVTEAPTASAAASQTPGPSQLTYVVQAGDTLNEIAQAFGTTVEAIMEANGLATTELTIGQVLVIP